MIHSFLRELSEYRKTLDKVVYYPHTHTAVIYLKKLDDVDRIVEKARNHGLHVSIQVNEQKKKRMIVVRELEVH